MSLYLTPDGSREDFYEWLLSDAAAAREERERRRRDTTIRARADRAQVRAWIQRTHANPNASADMVELADIMQRVTARQAAEQIRRDATDDRAHVRQARHDYEVGRRVRGDFDYQYPAAYLGAGADDLPIPDEPIRVESLQPGMRVRPFLYATPIDVATVEADPSTVTIRDGDGRRHDWDANAEVGLVRDDRYANPSLDTGHEHAATPALDEPEPSWLTIEYQGLCRGCLSDPCRCLAMDDGSTTAVDRDDRSYLGTHADDFGIDL